MNVELRLTARAEECRVFPPRNRHGVTLVPVAQQRESPVLRPFREPRVAMRQGDGAPAFGDPPCQAQAGKCLFHPMDDLKRAAVFAHERRRVDDEDEDSRDDHRVHPVTTTLSVGIRARSASLCACVLTPTTKSYPQAAAASRSLFNCATSFASSRLRIKSG